MLGSFVGLLGGSANIVAENKQRKAAEAYNAANAAQHDDTNAENTDFAAAQEAFEYAKQGASAAMQQAVEDLQSTGEVNTDEANIAAAVDAAISDDGSASITEVITPAKIYAVQKKGNGKNAVYTIVELESKTSVKPTTGKMYRSEAAAQDAARAKGYTIYGIGTAEQLPNIYRQMQAANCAEYSTTDSRQQAKRCI